MCGKDSKLGSCLQRLLGQDVWDAVDLLAWIFADRITWVIGAEGIVLGIHMLVAICVQCPVVSGARLCAIPAASIRSALTHWA